MGAGGSVPSTEAHARAEGYSDAQIVEYKASQDVAQPHDPVASTLSSDGPSEARERAATWPTGPAIVECQFSVPANDEMAQTHAVNCEHFPKVGDGVLCLASSPLRRDSSSPHPFPLST